MELLILILALIGAAFSTPLERRDCAQWYTVVSGDTCNAIVSKYPPLTLSQFYAFNPSVNNPSCNNLWPGVAYCVSQTTPPNPVCPTYTASCTKTYTVASGDICWKIVGLNGISLSDFYSWNPDVHSAPAEECNNLIPGCNYCVGASITSPCPQYTATCKKTYKVKSGDVCWSIVSSYGITLDNFYKWNPGVHSGSCDNLQPDCNYCVQA